MNHKKISSSLKKHIKFFLSWFFLFVAILAIMFSYEIIGLFFYGYISLNILPIGILLISSVVFVVLYILGFIYLVRFIKLRKMALINTRSYWQLVWQDIKLALTAIWLILALMSILVQLYFFMSTILIYGTKGQGNIFTNLIMIILFSLAVIGLYHIWKTSWQLYHKIKARRE